MNLFELRDLLHQFPSEVDGNRAFLRFLASLDVADPDDPRSMIRLASAHRAALLALEADPQLLERSVQGGAP